MTRVLGFDDPHVLHVFVAQAVEVVVKISELVWKNITVGYYIKFLFTILLLHFNDISNESVFSRKFVRVGKVINTLVILQLFVDMCVNTP